jgi:hypothetical protein
MEELYKKLGVLFIALIAIYSLYIMLDINTTIMEGFVTKKQVKNTAGSFVQESKEELKKKVENVKDILLINKYRDDYEDMLLDLDEFLNLSMLQAVNLFNMSTKKNGVDKDSMELAKQIVDANNFRKALDDIMVYLDKQN